MAKASIRHRLCHSLKRMANTFAFADGKAGECGGFADFNAKANGK